MQDDKQKKSLQQILGFNSPTVSAVSAATALAGILWSSSETNKMKTFADATKATQANINNIASEFETANKVEIANLDAAIEARGASEAASIRSGLANRGITDSTQADTSVARYQAGMSGAYAAARNALKRAKLSAESSLSSALGSYYQDMAKKQYESQVAKYAAKMGIWGSLGGLTGAVIDRIGNPGVRPATKSEDTSREEAAAAPEPQDLPNPADEYANPDQKAEQEA